MQASPSPAAVAPAMAACVKGKAHEGVIPAAAMTAFNAAVEHVLPGSVEVAKAYCEVVDHIVGNAGANAQNSITAGVATVALVLTAMTSHTHSEDVQQWGAYALGGLAWGNPVNIAGILSHGGPDVLYTAADIHIASANVQHRVCWALNIIADYSADGRAVLLRDGRADDVATRAKATHSDLDTPDRLLRELSAV